MRQLEMPMRVAAILFALNIVTYILEGLGIAILFHLNIQVCACGLTDQHAKVQVEQ